MLDQHIEQPEESTIFQKYPLVLTQKRLVTFIADNFRLMAMARLTPRELEGILDQELDTAEESLLTPSRFAATYRRSDAGVWYLCSSAGDHHHHAVD